MFRKLQAIVWACGLGVATVGVNGAEIQLIPVGASGVHTITGNEIILEGANQRVELEVVISGWDPDMNNDPLLRSWQVGIESASFSSGTLGVLAPPFIACATQSDPDHYCRSVLGGVCSVSGVACVDNSPCTLGAGDVCQGPRCADEFLSEFFEYCEPAMIHSGRADYIFKFISDFPAVDVETFDITFLSTSLGTNVGDPGVPNYAGTLFLDVPPVANGSFDITMDGRLLDPINGFIVPLTFTAARITIPCVTDQDCDDGDSCSIDICAANEVCRIRPNYDSATECCDPNDGTVCSLSSGLPGDANNSGTVDLEDAGWMQTCFGVSPMAPACAPLDLACDCDINLDDYSEFDALLTGP